ncbi:ParB/RepB/Spo0J family partition protein [Marinilongibacter aquaticus]|uniref:ParB/RepB/Spo0J family partition protein n=1 Tax=Marinilongibacter aquaticus TaxID=2975157 RepID=UPI0021BDC4CD|nr:ParB/RepB/Spo0J family partition protein [Marinilongibacter aquaticus]UBM60660.1 ParB/RepB/Spo0J family partition protein [Marinilongibacter aquaticus]
MGKGLGSLLSDSDLVVSKEVASFQGVKEIPVGKVVANPYQPRQEFDEEALQELAESIGIHGIIQPITVREQDGSYELISGERRLKAAKRAGLEQVPAYIRNVDDQRSLEMALIENIQRQNLNAIEIALSFRRMIDECELKQEELGSRVGKNRTTVNNYLRLLQLPAAVQSAITLGKISMGQARPLITLEDEDFQIELLNKIIKQGLSARKVEQLVKINASNEMSPLETYREDMRIEELSLKGRTIHPVKIKISQIDKGYISLPFEDEKELADLLAKLNEN